MIKVSIMYLNGPDVEFDHDYYAEKHMPMVIEACGPALKEVSIDRGISGRSADEPATYVCVGHLVFDSVEAWQQAMGPHQARLGGDVPNYTNTTAIAQVNEFAELPVNV